MKNKLIFSSALLLLLCTNVHAAILLDAQTCKVSMGNYSETLQLSPPCSVVKTVNDEGDFVQFGETKIYIISGAPAKLAELEKRAFKESDRGCSLEYQGVIVVNNKFSLSKEKDRGLVCPYTGLDTKFYQQYLQY
ncbi:hypothetical protein [Pseudoalteromonas sp. TB64]|uniref:hypothetical protein n=1 Tax=Pseudoalteromonas sp. TB64 TaxID=1938600 RepID=UPI000464AB40|nr:hypothetical protein [Pseudoalteromonas sp. TB64]